MQLCIALPIFRYSPSRIGAPCITVRSSVLSGSKIVLRAWCMCVLSGHLRQLLSAQRKEEEPARTQDNGNDTSGGQKASGEAQQDLFGGLTLSAAVLDDKLII
jgi:hypothetical protein